MTMEGEAGRGRLYLVGVGPGDPELMTCKAVRTLEEASVWIVPKAKENGCSSALTIASAKVPVTGKRVVELRFPMQKIALDGPVPMDAARAWREAADRVLGHVDAGESVAFPTLGDPSLYSTGFYLLAVLEELRRDLEVTVVPGITAMSACSATIGRPLALGDDVLTVVPAAFDDRRLRQILGTHDAVVLMKVHRRMADLVVLLEELDLVDSAVLIERHGFDDQQVYTDIRQAVDRPLHYFSTLLVRKRQVALGRD